MENCIKSVKAFGESFVIYVKNVENFVRQSNSINLSIVHKFPFINAVGVVASGQMVSAIKSLSEVKYMHNQNKVTALDSFKNFQDMYKSNLQESRECTQISGYGVTPTKPTVAVIDTGINHHLDVCLPNRVIKFVDFHSGKDFLYDDNGHGTFVSGVIAGSGLCSAGKVIGTAPGCNIVSVKVMDSDGQCGAFKVLEGMQWVFDNAKKHNIKLCCMSFGSDPLAEFDPLVIGANMLVKSNITVVCASGNSGKNTIKSPAISPYVISVGSISNDWQISEFTSRKTINGINKPDFYAVGEGITGLGEEVYTTMSGTSVSAPYVAGYALKIIERHPSFSPAEVKSMLYKISVKKNGLNIIL